MWLTQTRNFTLKSSLDEQHSFLLGWFFFHLLTMAKKRVKGWHSTYVQTHEQIKFFTCILYAFELTQFFFALSFLICVFFSFHIIEKKKQSTTQQSCEPDNELNRNTLKLGRIFSIYLTNKVDKGRFKCK